MQAKPPDFEISGAELRERVKRLGMTYARAAERLGLSLDGLNKQMRGDHRVGRQTVIILDFLEREWRPKPRRRLPRDLSKILW
jgi:transcriptional regulator with XRE-family HTH domain